jgi:hypothetical protein
MTIFRKLKGKICSLLAISMFGMTIHTTAIAGIVTTTEILDAQQVQQERERIQDWMARDDVRDQLTSLGVDVNDAQARVDGMTDQEVMVMASRMDEMSAGSGTGEVVIIGILVLVILELTGVTDIFTFI